MFALSFIGLNAGGDDPATISAAWSDIAAAWPATSATNEDRTISWAVGPSTRSVTASYSGANELQYRINSGSWTTYSAAFSLTSGQTLGWRGAISGNESNSPNTVYINGVALDTFTVTGSGYP